MSFIDCLCVAPCSDLEIPEFIEASVGLLLANVECMHVAFCEQRCSGERMDFNTVAVVDSLHACVCAIIFFLTCLSNS